jgi:ribonuclease BN (tRNA processing enzyme)
MACTAVGAGGRWFLVDAGSGALHACLQAGIDYDEIRGIFLTHFHIDHLLDLVQIVWLRHLRRDTLAGPLSIVGPPGLAALLGGLDAAFGGALKLACALLDVRELGPGARADVAGLSCEPFATAHTPESQGYRLADGTATVAFTGDTGLADGVVAACRGAAAAVLECSFAAPVPVETAAHLGPLECAEIGARSGVRHLLLTHLPAGADEEAILGAVRARYDGRVTVARDFLEVEEP